MRYRIFSIRLNLLLMVMIAGLMFTSCRAKYPQPRIVKTKTQIHSGNVSEYEVKSYIRQKPNKKILFIFPFHLTVYNLASHLKDNSAKKIEKIDLKIKKLQGKNKAVDYLKMEKKKKRTVRRWLMETIGEAPVLYDQSLTNQSVKQMELYLKTTGHFHAEVTSEVSTNTSGRKAKVTYHIYGNTLYTIAHFTWQSSDTKILSVLEKNMSESLIKEGMQYNEDIFDKERERISSLMRNNGYYHFSKSFITFNADTSAGNQHMDLQLIIKPYFVQSDDSLNKFTETSHPVSKIGKIYFNVDFRHDASNIHLLDTTVVEFRQHKKDTLAKIYYFIHEGDLKFKSKTLLKKCFLRTGDLIKINNAVMTNNGLASLGVFKYINIKFIESGTDINGYKILDAQIDLSRIDKQTVTTELEGTNSSGKLGISSNISYRNRNTLKGAESLSIRLRGAIEAQSLTDNQTDEDNIIDALPFNTIEGGIETELILPRFVMPFTDRFFTEKNSPKTSFSAGVVFQQRPDYIRYIGNLSFTYDWRENIQKIHQFSPVFLNLVRIFPDSLFLARIEQFSRPLQTSYKDHFISGFRYGYTFTNKSSTKTKKYMLLRTNIENTGLLARLFSTVFAGAEAGQTYYLFGIRFAQYTKADIDYRQYFNITDKSALVLRCFGGIGIPYGNIDVMPFDKRFSSGGSNDIRAWKFRSLGPGSYSDNLNFDKTGDISLIGNIEYRFPVYDIVQSALFIDAGNIWMLKQYVDYPGGTFKANTFYKEFAVGAGVGIRLNFGFFIFRLDAAIPLHDPALPEGERWVGFTRISKRTNFNFGIGYPF